MTWSPERTTVNQRLQFGAESTSALGTSVAASKQLLCYDLQVGVSPDITLYTPTGSKYATVQNENMEWVDATVGGQLDYSCCIYPLASAMGSVTPVAHLASATAKDWIFSPPTSGSVVPQTYTIEQGDSTHAHKFTYGLFTQFGYKLDRKTSTISGKILGQQLQDGITMTSTPTAVSLNPVVGKQVNVYLDPTFSALGTTQLTRVISVDYSTDSIYGPLWVLNRATTGLTCHVDTMPKSTVKIKVEADSAGMALLGYLQTGTTYFLRVDAQGAQIASDGPGAINNEFQHDMAIKIGKPSTFADEQGIFAIEWECAIINDGGWGHAQKITVTNLLTSL